MVEVNVRIEEKEAFKVIGRKIWISGQDNELFGKFPLVFPVSKRIR